MLTRFAVLHCAAVSSLTIDPGQLLSHLAKPDSSRLDFFPLDSFLDIPQFCGELRSTEQQRGCLLGVTARLYVRINTYTAVEDYFHSKKHHLSGLTARGADNAMYL